MSDRYSIRACRRKHVIKISFGGHHDRAFLVPQPFNEPEHLLAPLEICSEEVFKQRDGIDDHPVGLHFLDKFWQLVLDPLFARLKSVGSSLIT